MNRYIRPVVYKSFQRCVIALTLVLLWDRFVNKGRMPWAVNGCFAAGAVFLALAWLAFCAWTESELRRPAGRSAPGGGEAAIWWILWTSTLSPLMRWTMRSG